MSGGAPTASSGLSPSSHNAASGSGVHGGGGHHGYFTAMSAKSEQCRVLLDSSDPKDKLEGMKRIISGLSKGKDVAFFFPDVVKNVICDSIDVKKLVYMFVIHYAEIKQEEALLSINSFQKDLKSSSQYIRALALRTMSSLHVPVISQIVAHSIRKCASDTSTYVRKTAALAISKASKLDPSIFDELIEVLQLLLHDRSPVVLSAAMRSLSAVCPTRLDLIHPIFRRLCRVLADCDEWGQISIINLMIEYARTQFTSPFVQELRGERKNRAFYSDEEEDSEEDTGPVGGSLLCQDLDHDLQMLLKACQPLLRSRNSSVVMSVASLFFHVAPYSQAELAAKPLIRILKNTPEFGFLILSNIATMASTRPGMFSPYVKSFFVSGRDPFYLRKLKLEVMTLVANDSNVHPILKEFQSYLKDPNKKFVQETVRCMGRVASEFPETAKRCLSALMKLIHSKSEDVVAESVVVMRHLLQRNPEEHGRAMRKMARLIKKVEVPMARASCVWVVGEFAQHMKRLAPDVLRRLAQSFTREADITKLQILTMASKMFVKFGEMVELHFIYILNLAKYDQSYDVRDRARLLRQLVVDVEEKTPLQEFLESVMLSEKPMPQYVSEYKARQVFRVGSLSLAMNHNVQGYRDLPNFPEVAPPGSVRDVEAKEQAAFWDSASSEPSPSSSKKGNLQVENLEDFLRDESDGSSFSGSGSGSFYSSRSGSPSFSEGSYRSNSGSLYSREDSSQSGSSFYSSESRSRSGSESASYSGSSSPGGSFSGSESDSYSGSSRSPSPAPRRR